MNTASRRNRSGNPPERGGRRRPRTYAATGELKWSKWSALRTLSAAFRVLAFLFLAAGGVGVVVGLVVGARHLALGVWIIVASVFSGAVSFITFLAVAELIILMIHVEDNTHQTTALMQQQLQRPQSPPGEPPRGPAEGDEQ